MQISEISNNLYFDLTLTLAYILQHLPNIPIQLLYQLHASLLASQLNIYSMSNVNPVFHNIK